MSTPSGKTYWAAVVEFSSEPANESSDIRLANTAAAYVDIIQSSDAILADIIVFPEATLNHRSDSFFVPDPSDLVAPCNNDSGFHPALRNISCSARDAKKYVVINVTEKKNLTVNSTDITVQYNTNVVFDRNGVVISTYRKFNLFNEPGTNVTADPELGFFTTDFNVTFGHFICFDILFKTPALDLRLNHSITDFVYPTMWFSEMPFMTALQTQMMWAKHGVNLLAAGASNPDLGSSGSGIYSKRGAITSIFTGVPTRRVITAEVPKKEYWDDEEIQSKFLQQSHDSTDYEDILMTRDNLAVYSWKMLIFPEGESLVKERLCYDELCCDFEMKVYKESNDKLELHYRHAIVVFDGVRAYGESERTGGVFSCAMISCLNDAFKSCGLSKMKAPLMSEVFFKELNIKGTFRSTMDTLPGPTSLTYELQPIPGFTYRYKEGEEFKGVK